MIDIDQSDYLGPLKIFGNSKPSRFVSEKEGWFYPLFLSIKEAILFDVNNGGRGQYKTIQFYEYSGEFYYSDTNITFADESEPVNFTSYSGKGAENPFSRIKNRLSSLVDNQVPDFVREDYTNFITFIKTYYEYLEQNNKAQEILENFNLYSDIDETSEFLVRNFLEFYSPGYTTSKFADNRFVMKKIREVYRKKGTEDAYRILFNILFSETVQFLYPYNLLLKSSDGNWEIPQCLRTKIITSETNLFDFENTLVRGLKSNATAIVNAVNLVDLGDSEVYELYLDSDSVVGFFVANEKIIAEKNIDNNVFTIEGELYSVISKVNVLDPGIGYLINQPISITDVSGKFAKARIDGVDRFGKITSIEMLDAGINYSNLTVLDPGLPEKEINGTYNIKQGAVTVKFPIEHGIVAGKRLEVSYTGNIFSPVDNTSHSAIVASVPDIKTIRFRYPGF
jgi:hypothetical protein